MIRILLTTVLFHFVFAASAQQLDLGPLNSAFSGNVSFNLDKYKRLVMDFTDETGRYRQDIAPLDQLDPAAVHFSTEENSIVVECAKEHQQCISKEIFKLDLLRITSRCTLPKPSGDTNGATSVALLQDLLRTVAAENARSADETTPTSSRKKGR